MPRVQPFHSEGNEELALGVCSYNEQR